MDNTATNDAPDSGESEEQTSENQTTQKTPETEEELPAWARAQITKANNEAAKKRIEAKDAADNAKKEAADEYQSTISQLNEEKASLNVELEGAREELMKLEAALAVGIPGESAAEFAELLKGSTKREISAHAEKVKELFDGSQKPSRAVDPSQGMQDGNQKLSAGQMLANVVRSN